MWEREPRAGGQIDLALAAPDKEDVSGVWTYRVASLDQLDVPIRTGVEPTLDRIRAYAPDLIVIATGATPRDRALSGQHQRPAAAGLGRAAPAGADPRGFDITVVGGGMVGIETAECIAKRAKPRHHSRRPERRCQGNGAQQPLGRAAAPARSQGEIVTGVPVMSIEGDTISCRSGEDIVRHPAGDRIVLAVGARPVRDVAKLADEAGVPWVMVGDCNNVPGDFLTAIRDASMIAWAAEEKFPAAPGKVRAMS